MKNICLKIPEAELRSSPVVLATVISTQGSTPQKEGSSAIFSGSGLLHGTVGGGVLEGRVQKIATEAAKTGISGIYDFDFNYDINSREEAICGGRATVLIDAGAGKHTDIFRSATEVLKERRSCILATIITGEGKERIITDRRIITNVSCDGTDPSFRERIQPEAVKMLESRSRDSFCLIDLEGHESSEVSYVMLEHIIPPEKLIIAGAGHIGRALCHIGSLLDFEVTVIDDRSEYANPENLPEADIIMAEDIGGALEKIEKESDTYIVIVTRGHSDDANALLKCIGSNAAYVGMIGSRAKIEKMQREFIENGHATEEQWKSVHAPIGLEIGSQSVEEIAISISAELVMVRNNKKQSRRLD